MHRVSNRKVPRTVLERMTEAATRAHKTPGWVMELRVPNCRVIMKGGIVHIVDRYDRAQATWLYRCGDVFNGWKATKKETFKPATCIGCLGTHD